MDATKGAQPALRLAHITKRFGKLTANGDISIEVSPGEVVALLGENGAGKTTLMNIIFGHYVADEGQVEVFGKPLPPGNPRAALDAGVGMVHQHFTLADNMTVLDNIILGTEPLWSFGFGRGRARAKIRDLAESFGLVVDVDARISALSVGERQRVEILKALYRDARILILDEPTAVLTPQEVTGLFDTLRRAVAGGLAVIFISHKLHEVMDIADRVVVLRHGRVTGAVATDQTDRAALAEMMVGSEIVAPNIQSPTPGAEVLRLDAVTTATLRDVTLALRAGQITGLAGVSGNGQAALAALIGGLDLPIAGRMVVNGTELRQWTPRAAIAAGVGRIPEDRHDTGTIGDFSLTENAILESYARVPFSRKGWLNWRKAGEHTQEIIAAYDVRCPGPEAMIRTLSGGNMQKLILGRVLEAGPSIILANQPVRGLDIGAVTYVQEQLLAARDAGAAVLLISEDLDEILTLSDVIHVISEGRLSPEFARGTKTAVELGQWMAGSGFGETGHAA